MKATYRLLYSIFRKFATWAHCVSDPAWLLVLVLIFGRSVLWSVHPVPGALLAFFLASAPCSWLPYSLVPWTWLCADCMDWQDCIFHVFFGVFLWDFCSLPGLFLGASQPCLLLLLGPSSSVLDGVGLPGCILCFSPLSDALFRLRL